MRPQFRGDIDVDTHSGRPEVEAAPTIQPGPRLVGEEVPRLSGDPLGDDHRDNSDRSVGGGQKAPGLIAGAVGDHKDGDREGSVVDQDRQADVVRAGGFEHAVLDVRYLERVDRRLHGLGHSVFGWASHFTFEYTRMPNDECRSGVGGGRVRPMALLG